METLLAFAPGILAIALAVVLRLSRRSREKPAQIAALEEKVAALKQRLRELEEAKARASEFVRDASLRGTCSASPKKIRHGTQDVSGRRSGIARAFVAVPREAT